jgi:transcriptional regulator with XRE-family HTH domain
MAETQTFGQWLRHRRRSMDLTQDALSHAIGCAQITIRKMEADRLRPSRQLAGLLFEKLGIPPEKHDLYIRFARSGILASSLENLPRNNLPHAITSFIGRQCEMIEVNRLLNSSRLVTLTGAGGSGKTRLALQAAAGTLERYQDGAWFVEFASITDPELVPQVIAGTLGYQKTGEAS